MGNHYPLSPDLPGVIGEGGRVTTQTTTEIRRLETSRAGNWRGRMMAEGSKLDAAKGTTVFVFFQKLLGGVSLNLLILTLIMQNTRKCIVLILNQRSA